MREVDENTKFLRAVENFEKYWTKKPLTEFRAAYHLPEAGRIYEENRSFMFGVAYNHVHNKEDAEDVVQEAAIRLMQQRKSPEDERGFTYTLTDHSSHAFLDKLHTQKRDYTKTEPLDLSNPKHHPLTCSTEKTVLDTMELEEVLEMAPLETKLFAFGYRLHEISDKLGSNLQTIYSRIKKWRKENSQ